ncbi:MAG TPA: hypothetical protein DEB40_12475 [Elusimicrobia bacterium]|nr:hypothetical protein [Elusimicrobiota bacterium]HBT62550.1 hypothetical protein [Elusimicrobiota bacterium]
MIRRLSALLVAISLLSACAPAAQEREPNNDFAHAGSLSPNGRARGAVSSPDDADWYKMTVDRDAGIVRLHVGGIRDVDFALSFQNGARQELKRIDETGTGGDEEALDLGVTRGDYYVVLSNKNSKANNPKQKYVLSARLESAQGREREPDDTPLTATPLETNGLMRGRYFPTQNPLADGEDKAEEDWFRIKADKAGVFALNLDLSGVPNVDPVLEMYDVNGYKLKEVNDNGVGEGEMLKDFGVRAPSEYALRLRTRGRRMGNPDVFYELLTELIPYDGRAELEPDDQRQDATPMRRESLSAHIAPAGDVDWFEVNDDTVPQRMLRVDLSALAGMDLVLTVTDEIGQPVRVVDNAGKEAPETLTGLGISNATYYLVVGEKTGKAADTRYSYNLAKALVPWQAGLEWELNDTTATAQAVELGESVDGYLAPKGDVDHYEFGVSSQGVVSVELTGVFNVRWNLELYDRESLLLQSQIAAKSGEPVALDKELEAGIYWLRLRAEDPGQNNVRDKYTLRLRAK